MTRYHNNPKNTFLGLCTRPINTILDVGANLGQSAKEYRKTFPNATIYCFEPLPDVYYALDTWAQTQRGKVFTFNLALGDKTSEVMMNYHLGHSSSSSLLQTTPTNLNLFPQQTRQNKVLVTQRKLDDLAQSLKLIPELLVKMDVQGYEMQVIEGGKQTLSQAVACILEVSLLSLFENQASFDSLTYALYNLGFEYAGNLNQVYDRKGNIIYIDTVFTKAGLWE